MRRAYEALRHEAEVEARAQRSGGFVIYNGADLLDSPAPGHWRATCRACNGDDEGSGYFIEVDQIATVAPSSTGRRTSRAKSGPNTPTGTTSVDWSPRPPLGGPPHDRPAQHRRWLRVRRPGDRKAPELPNRGRTTPATEGPRVSAWSGRYAARIRERVREIYGETCWICGRQILEGFSVDHVIPRSRGGTDEIENLRPAHGLCNSRRGNRGIVRPISPTSREW